MIRHFRNILAAICFLFICSSYSWAQLTGKVFIDENNNGVMDRGERGVENAVLSDGLNVVKTDEKGNFILPGWDKQRFVTLYTGGDFTSSRSYLPVNSDRQTYLFAVHQRQRQEKVSFVHISDTETFEFRDWVDQLKQYTQVHRPDFIIHTGDICYQSGMQWHAKNINQESFGVPVYYCLGNHDLIKGDYGEEFFEQSFGPAWYAFEEANTLFIVTPMMGGDYKPSFKRAEIGAWLKNLLNVYPAEKSKIVFNHDLLTNGSYFDFKVHKDESIRLNDYNLKAWLYGHWHTNMAKTHGQSGIVSYGTSTLAAGGIDHSPSGFRVVEVDQHGKTSSFFRWTNVKRQIKIIAPQKHNTMIGADGLIQLAANVYHTGAMVDSVRYALYGDEGFSWTSSLDESKWKQMQQESDWTWTASFKPDLKTEQYTLVAHAFLHSGEILSAKHTFSIASSENMVDKNGNWYNLAGDSAHDPVTDTQHSLPYHLQWTTNIGSNIFMSSPVLCNNMVVTAGFDDGNASDCYMVGLDVSTGKKRWRFQTHNSIKNQMVIAEGIVIATDMQGVTYALDAVTGQLKWKHDLNYHRLPGIVTGLVTDGKVVYTGFGKSLCALAVATGEVVWTNKAWSGGEGTTPTMTIADDILIASSQWGAIYAHNRYNGELLWKRSDAGLRFRDGVIGYKEGALWVTAKGADDSVSGLLYKLDPATGETIHTYKTGMHQSGTSAPIILNDRFIIAGSHPGVTAIDRKTGMPLWLFEVEPALLYTPPYYADHQKSIESTPVLIDDKLVFGAMDGRIYILDVQSGKLLWHAELGAPVLTTVAVNNNQFFICDYAGNVYCYRSSKQ